MMVRLSWSVAGALLAALVASNSSLAEHKTAYELFPATTQAVVWIPDADELSDRWNRTQLAKLAADPAIRPFFDGQRQEIEERLIEAGWRLNIRPSDLSMYMTGQIGVAWMRKEGSPRKPFMLGLIADVADDATKNRELFDEINRQLESRQPNRAELDHDNFGIVKYTLPKRAGQLLAEHSFYAVVDGHFLATDDEALMRQMIDRVQGDDGGEGVLIDDPDFTASREKLQLDGDGQIEYFVRPIGFAKVLRAIAGKRTKSSTDILAVLENQGFASIQAISGEILLGQELLDMKHHGFVMAETPLPKSAAVLDFPNKSSDEIPDFVSSNIATFLSANWNAEEAFWKVEGLVDELAGTEGVFENVIEGIKLDPNGPRIDIRSDVLPQFTNDIFAISDSKPGAPEVDSRRNLIALKIKDTEAMRRVIDRAMRNEPDAELFEFEGRSIWKVVHREDAEVIDLESDFGEFGAPVGGDDEARNQSPWLNNWAITVDDGYLMFASHAEMIEDAIRQLGTGQPSPLIDEEDYKRLTTAMQRYFGDEASCTWQLVRNDMAYRVQYELFRQGKLRDSQSMLSSILDRLLDKDSEIREETQKIDGQNLPPFEKISPFLHPGGLVVRATEDGWMFGGLLISDKPIPPAPPASELTETAPPGTARVSDFTNESKR